MSVLIKGGHIVTAADDYVADILIEGETVAEIGRSLDVSADRVIDAVGQVRDPGRDRPPHAHGDAVRRHGHLRRLHLGHDIGGVRRHHLADRLLPPGSRPVDSRRARHLAREDRALPAGDRRRLPLAITDLHDGGKLEDVAKAPDQGVTSYKLFMAYKGAIMVDDETLFRVMQVAAETGALVMVHAENGDVIDVLVKQALAEGKTEPQWHAATRPPHTEGEATSRAIQLAHLADCPLYVVHVSCEESIEPVAAARAAGWRIWGETCTQYLFIEQKDLEEPDFQGAKYVFTPPPRPPHNHESSVARDHQRDPVGGLERPLPVPDRRSEDARQGRLLEDPQRRARDREPAAHAPPLRGARGPDVDEPPRGPVLHAARQAVRTVPAQGHDRSRQRRRHRRVGQR